MNPEPVTSDTKVCPRCAETIKAAAKVCPFCQSRLSFFGLWWHDLAGLVSALILVGMVAAILAWLIPDDPRFQGRDFARHREDLVVHLSLESGQNRPEFWLSGTVTNQGSHPWRVREIEVRFLNADGSLLDVRHAQIENPFVVPPARESAFRVRLGRLPPAVSRAPLQARVQKATDGDMPRDPD